MPKPTLLKFFLEKNEDTELTCLICVRNNCDQCFVTRGAGKTAINGVHSDCVQAHNDRMTKTNKES